MKVLCFLNSLRNNWLKSFLEEHVKWNLLLFSKCLLKIFLKKKQNIYGKLIKTISEVVCQIKKVHPNQLQKKQSSVHIYVHIYSTTSQLCHSQVLELKHDTFALPGQTHHITFLITRPIHRLFCNIFFKKHISIHVLSMKIMLPCIFGAAEESEDAAWYGKSVFNCKR